MLVLRLELRVRVGGNIILTAVACADTSDGYMVSISPSFRQLGERYIKVTLTLILTLILIQTLTLTLILTLTLTLKP